MNTFNQVSQSALCHNTRVSSKTVRKRGRGGLEAETANMTLNGVGGGQGKYGDKQRNRVWSISLMSY